MRCAVDIGLVPFGVGHHVPERSIFQSAEVFGDAIHKLLDSGFAVGNGLRGSEASQGERFGELGRV